MLALYSSDQEIISMWYNTTRLYDEERVLSIARFAESRAIVAARKIIAEKDAEIMELKKEIVVMRGPRQ